MSINQTLNEMVRGLPAPTDDWDNHYLLTPLRLSPNKANYDDIVELVDEFMALSQGGRNNKAKAALRKHWEYVLLNLSSSTEQAYARGDLLEKRYDMMECWGDYCASGANQ
jgi:hypothetical protein